MLLVNVLFAILPPQTVLEFLHVSSSNINILVILTSILRLVFSLWVLDHIGSIYLTSFHESLMIILISLPSP